MNWRRWFSTSDDVSILPTRHKFPVDSKLENRRIAAARKLGIDVTPRVTSSWSWDANGSPIDYDDFEAPIG